MPGHFQVMKSLSLALFLCTLAATARGSADRDHADRLADFRGVAFGEVRAASVARLVDRGRPNFHGLTLAGDWLKLGATAQAGLANALREPIDRWIRLYAEAKGDSLVELDSFCVPDYGYAVRLETDMGVRDFAICLRCGQVAVYGRRKEGVSFSLKDEALAKLNACYRDEFGPASGPENKP